MTNSGLSEHKHIAANRLSPSLYIDEVYIDVVNDVIWGVSEVVKYEVFVKCIEDVA